MILSLKQLGLLVPSGALAESFYNQFVTLAKGSSVLDVAIVPEAFRKDLVELFEAHPQVVATVEEVEAAAVEKAGAERVVWWMNVGKNGRRLAKIHFNQARLLQWLEQNDARTGEGLSITSVDKAVAALDGDGVLQWEVVVAPAPALAPAQTPPAPPPRKLPNDEVELPLDASESEMRRASVAQLQDLDRRRNPNRHAPTHGFEPMPPEISRKALINAPVALIKTWERRFGRDAIDARLQGRG